MAEEEETREVLFPDWEGPDKTGLTIEQTSEGEIFVKEVKGESPAARSGKVYEGDQIVGATVYFDNMSSEETAELLKTLNRHKVGLKLQNKGDKSPCYSPLSTPCRSPMGTLTWEGTTRFGGSSPDIILSGEDEDYKRIYTKKIKPRLKSEDLAEGVDVRTERHSSTSSDGSTITTITRRITTYTVDMPGGISEKLELSSPEFKGLRHESGDGSPRIRISHGNLSGIVGAEEGVFESSNVSYTGPQVSSTGTHRGSGVVQTTTIIREGERGTGSRHITIGGLGGAELTSADENGGSISLALPGKSMHFVTSSMDRTQEGSVDTSVGGKTKVKISESTITHPQAKGSGNDHTVRFGGSRVIDTELTGGGIGGSAITIGNVSSGYSSVPSKISVAGMDVNLTGSKLKGEVDVNLPSTQRGIKASGIDSEVSGIKSESAVSGMKMSSVNMPVIGVKGIKNEGTSVEVKLSGDADMSVPVILKDVQKPELDIKGADIQMKCPSAKIEGPAVNVPKVDIKGSVTNTEGKEGDFKMPQIKTTSFGAKGPKVHLKATEVDIKAAEVDVGGSDINTEGLKIKTSFKTGPTLPAHDVGLKGSKVKGDVDLSVPKTEGHTTKPEVEIKGPEVNIERCDGGFGMSKNKKPSFGLTGPKGKATDVDIKLAKPEIAVKAPEVDIKASKVNVGSPDIDITTTEIDIKGPQGDIKGTNGGVEIKKIKVPSFGFKGPKVEGPDVDINLPKANIDVKSPEIDIKGPTVDIEGPKIKGPNVTLPKFSMSGPKLKSDVDVSVPTIERDIKIPNVDVSGPEGGFEMPKIKLPSLGFKGPKVEGPDIDINLPKSNVDLKAPDLDINVKGPKAKGKMSASMPKLEGDIKGPNADIAAPTITMEGVSIDTAKTGVTFPKFKGPKFGMKFPEVEGPESTFKSPTFSAGVKGPKTEVSLPDTEVSLDAPDIDINVKGKKGKFKLPKVKGKAKKPDVDIETPAVNLDVDTPNIHVKGTKVKKPLFGRLHFPGVELDIKSPKLKGDGSSGALKSTDVDLPSVSLNTTTDSPNVSLEGPDVKLKTPNIKMPNVNMSAPDIDASLNRQGEATMSADFKGQKINVKGGAEIDASVSGGSASGGLHYPEGTVTFPKLKVPKFGIALPQLEGQQGGRNVESEVSRSGGISIQPPSVTCQDSSQNIEVPSPELRHSEGKVKVKMPKLFGKSKAKGSSVGDLRGPEVELSASGKGGKVSKDLSVHSGKLELEGDPALSVSSKGKSASLDLFKKSRHRSSSLSDEGGLAVSSPSTHLEAEGGDISLDLGGSKVKGKKGKLKFGTFGGFGSKSKGSYEVTLGEDSETGVEGSAGVSLSKKSRLSSSSSSDSGSRGGFRFPRLELSVSPKK